MAALVDRSSTMKLGLASLGYNTTDLEEGPSEFNKTRSIIGNLVRANVVQLREMHIAFGVISIALAILVIVRIWYDSWRASKLQVKLRPRFVAFCSVISDRV
jgi:hypothetical protein